MRRPLLARIVGGYLEAVREWLRFLLVVAVCAAAGLLITLPLWFFATSFPAGYSVFVTAAAAGAVAIPVFLFLGNRSARGGLSIPRFLRTRIVPKVLRAVVLLAGIAAALILLAWRRFLLLAAFLLLFLFLFGWFRYGRRRL